MSMNITKQDFLKYEKMRELKTFIAGLSKQKIVEIQNNYKQLKELYLKQDGEDMTRITIKDTSFSRFCNRLVTHVKAFPEAKIINLYTGDSEKSDGNFMFTVLLEVIKE